MKRRFPGRVVSIRINPKDCMAAIDVIDKINMKVPGMSFAQVVSAAFSSAMESLRRANIIPTRDGFEFSEMMRVYPPSPKGSRGRTIAITETFGLAGSDGQIPAAVLESPAAKRARARFEALREKARSGEELSPGEESEYMELQQDFA